MNHLPTLLLSAVVLSSSSIADENPAVRAAEKLLDRGEFERAKDAFEAVLSESTDDGDAHHGLGKALMGLGKWPEAIDHLVLAAKLLPDDYQARFDLGLALYDRALLDVAEEDYEAAGYRFLDARRMFEKAAALRPALAAPWIHAARAERDRGERDSAISLLDKAVQIEPDDVTALLELGGLLFAQHHALSAAGDPGGASDAMAKCRTTYTHALEVDPRNGYALNGQAWIARLDGEEPRALELFHESLKADPTIDDSYRNLITALSADKAGRKRLIDMLDDVVRTSARYAIGDERKRGQALAYYYRGVAHKYDRDPEAAKADLAKAESLAPQYAAACAFQLAAALFRDNQYDEASTKLAAVARQDIDTLVGCLLAEPDGRAQAVAYRNLVQRSYERGATDDARSIAQVVAYALDNSPDDWNNYAFFCRETGHYEDAYYAYQRALELNPDDPSLQNDTALILQYHLGRDIEYAAELYEGAIRNGKSVLEDANADSFAKDAARVAVRDASNNLRLLKEGKYVGGAGDRSSRREPKRGG